MDGISIAWFVMGACVVWLAFSATNSRARIKKLERAVEPPILVSEKPVRVGEFDVFRDNVWRETKRIEVALFQLAGELGYETTKSDVPRLWRKAVKPQKQ